MRILYSIQGTGNGHIARAEDVIPVLREHGKVDIFVSGAQADLRLEFPVKYRSKGLSFYFGRRGGVDLMKTFNRNSTADVYREIREFPVERYDLVVNDFEPITAWACLYRRVPCVGLSHQAALLSPCTPRPKTFDPVGEWIIRHYAPVKKYVGFHFSRFDDNIFTPVIRQRIREAAVTNRGHITVYLPAYDDRKLIPVLGKFPAIRWHVFSKHTRTAYHHGRISIYPVSNEEFTASMTSSAGVLCGAGFETPAEAIYLRKKLLVVPMKNQHEQHYNAAALKQLGIPVMKKVKKNSVQKIQKWLDLEKYRDIFFDNTTAQAVDQAVGMGAGLSDLNYRAIGSSMWEASGRMIRELL